MITITWTLVTTAACHDVSIMGSPICFVDMNAYIIVYVISCIWKLEAPRFQRIL